MSEDAIETLRLFNAKVERLQSSSLVAILVQQGSRLTLSWTAETSLLQLALSGPTAEQVDAFVLTMRLFMQDKDRISLRNVARLYESLRVSEDLKKYYAMHLANLNKFLDGHAFIAIDGDRPTRREVLETVLYGELSHVEPAKQSRYRAWVANPLAGGMITFEFVGILQMYIRTLAVMAEINRRALAELGVAPGGETAGSEAE